MARVTAPLGEICPAKPLKPESVSDTEIVWQLNLDQIEADSGAVLSKQYAPANEAGNSTHWFDERHVLYSKLRPYLNKVVLPDEVGIATTELVPLLADAERINRSYLSYYLRSKAFVNWVNNQVAGAKMPRVSMKAFWNHEIPLPPLKEQKRIAAILDKADAIRRKRQQAIQLADQFLRAVFLDMFGDPVTNPKGWDICKLKDIALIQIGPFGTQLHKEDYVSGGIPLVNPTHIVNGKIVPNMDLSVSEEKYSNLSEYHLYSGDIVMGRRGEMGRCAIVGKKEEGWMCGTGSLYIRPKTNESFSLYLYALLSGAAVKAYLESESLGATMPNLNKGIVGGISIPMPDDSVLSKFSDVRRKALGLLDKHDFLLNHDLFEALSQKAFTGNL